MFRKVKGLTKNVYLPVTPSTVFAERSLVTFDSGALVPATAATTAGQIAGIIVGPIAATDPDYAVARRVAVEVPVEKHVVYEFNTTGLVAGDVGSTVDLSDASTVNRAASAIGIARIIARITATKGRAYLRINDAF